MACDGGFELGANVPVTGRIGKRQDAASPSATAIFALTRPYVSGNLKGSPKNANFITHLA